jgi:hypothetical protein
MNHSLHRSRRCYPQVETHNYLRLLANCPSCPAEYAHFPLAQLAAEASRLSHSREESTTPLGRAASRVVSALDQIHRLLGLDE